MLEKTTGVRPVGARTASWDFSPHTLRITREAGLLYDSSLMADVDCYELLLDGEPTGVIEFPVEWIRDDAVYFMMHRFQGLRPYTPPSDVFDVFRREFEAAYEEGGIFQLTCHPHIIGYRSRLWIIEELIRPGQGEGRRLVRNPCRRGPLRPRTCRLRLMTRLAMTKTALVTGGARGIGRACALALADSGFDIALVDLLEKEMASTARDIEARGRRTLSFQADVSDFARAHAIVEADRREMGTARRAPEQCGRAEPETDPRDQRGRV